MALSPRIEIRQSQSLVMTPQLQQAIRLLQMSNLELADYVATMVETNPLLEEVRPVARAQGPGPGGPRGQASDGASAVDLAAAEVTLRDHLRAQIGAARCEAAARAAALILVDEIDADGYLRVPLDEVGARHGIGAEAMAAGLALLQGADPTGVGARDLAECLALQLRERGDLDATMEALLGHLDLLGEGRRDELAVLCGVEPGAIAGLTARLRRLDPKPGARFATEIVQVAVPDVHVRRAAGGGWKVELNTETLPRVLVNNAYAAEFGRGEKAARQFISECSAQANWLVRSLEQRARTILRVASEVVVHQERFFDAGPAGIRPLTQRALADRLGLHESTVSRVTAGKYVACEQGLFELRFFFSSAIQAMAGGEAFSAAAVQERIRGLVSAEIPPRPLSDDKIVAILQAEGIDIARRTVAKYREVMGIPSSVDRRRSKAASARPARVAGSAVPGRAG